MQPTALSDRGLGSAGNIWSDAKSHQQIQKVPPAIKIGNSIQESSGKKKGLKEQEGVEEIKEFGGRFSPFVVL